MAHNYTNDLTRGLAFLKASNPHYTKRQNYYHGEVPEVFGSRRIRRAMRELIERYRLNFAATPVDALMRRVSVSSIKAVGKDTITTMIEERIADPNDLDEDLDFWFTRAGYFADYYVLVEPNVEVGDEADDEGDPEVMGDVTGVSMFGKDPLTTAILYNRVNDRLIDFGIQVWKLPLAPGAKSKIPLTRANLYYDDETYQLITQPTKKGVKADEFVPLNESDGQTGAKLSPSIPNEFGFPIFHYRIDDKPYGIPAHEKFFGSQDAITKQVSTHMGAVDFIGFPQRWALVDAANATDDAAEDFGSGLESGYEGAAGTRPTRAKSGLSSGPGEVWWLDGIKSVGQFAQADTDKLLNGILFYIKAGGKLTDTPLYEFDLGGNEPSGEARRRMDGPIDKHAGKVMKSFGKTTESMIEYALKVLGEDDVNVTVSWDPAEIVTDQEGWTTFETKTMNGIPLRQALLEMGYDQTQIDEWYPEDTVAISPKVANSLADSLRFLGIAANGGMVSAVDAANFFPSALVAARPEGPTPKITDAVALATNPADKPLPAELPAPPQPAPTALPPLE